MPCGCWRSSRPDVLQRLQQARRHLGDWLTDSHRQAHITLAIAGFLVEQPRYDDDDACPQQLAALRQQLREQPPCALTLNIGGLDSFASAAFLAVSDPQRQLPGLRQQLARGDDFRDSPYLPHLTVGLYPPMPARHRGTGPAACLYPHSATAPDLSQPQPVPLPGERTARPAAPYRALSLSHG